MTALEHAGKNKRGQHRWSCICICRTKKIITGDDLRSGHTKSCGCIIKNGNNLKHGYSHSKTYNAWKRMKSKYNDPGITICNRWLEPNGQGFKNFLKDMGKCPIGLTLERINKNKGYYKKNCQWSTRKEQSRNRKSNDLITFNNKTQCLKDWAIELNIKYETLWARIYVYEWSIEIALTTPVHLYHTK